MSTRYHEYSEKELVEKDKKHMVHGWGYSPIVYVEGKGSVLKDINGKEYIDALSTMAGPTGIGHSHPKVVEAVKTQAEKLICSPAWAINIPKIELCEKLAKITPSKLTKFSFSCGGSEAVEVALKAVMRITGKKEIISLILGNHGQTIATMALSHRCRREGYLPIPGFRQIPPPYCYRCFYGKTHPGCDLECARALELMIKYGTYNDVAAFIVEPILSAAGHVAPPTKDYFQIIREICDKYHILLIDDEIQTGFGRLGKMWGCEYFEFQPDIMVLGKAMGGGLPISATVFREDIVIPDLEKEGSHIFSFSGHPILCAAASATIDVVTEENLPQRAAETGKIMMDYLRVMQRNHRLIGDVRGAGLFIGVELVKDKETKEEAVVEASKVMAESEKRGVLFSLSHIGGVGNTIKIKPPMNISKKLALRALEILDEVLTDIEKGLV